MQRRYDCYQGISVILKKYFKLQLICDIAGWHNLTDAEQDNKVAALHAKTVLNGRVEHSTYKISCGKWIEMNGEVIASPDSKR